MFSDESDESDGAGKQEEGTVESGEEGRSNAGGKGKKSKGVKIKVVQEKECVEDVEWKKRKHAEINASACSSIRS